jgi:peptidoglycan/xylan/chitin deacetylase (PgdA/CDA1 family)
MHPARLLLFWDYDTQWGTDADRRRGLPATAVDGRQEFACTERLLELLDRYEIPACFGVVGAAALPGVRPYHDPDQIRRIHAAGHEIASHGFHHEWVPGLDAAQLRTMLARSKEALEACIGAPVTAFVPPYNQPFDHAPQLSISWSERRAVPRNRTDVGRLCQALAESGYDFCRVAYRPLRLRVLDRFAGHQVDRPVRIERIKGVRCVRLNAPCGFARPTIQRVDEACRRGGIIVAYGHPHSLHAGGAQDEQSLIPFLERVQELRSSGQLVPLVPRELAPEEAPA